MLGGTPLLTAVEKFLADTKAANLRPITIPDLVKEFIAAKTTDGLSTRYIKDCELRLGRFGRDLPRPVANVKTAEIDTWLRSLNQSPRSRITLDVQSRREVVLGAKLCQNRRTYGTSITRVRPHDGGSASGDPI